MQIIQSHVIFHSLNGLNNVCLLAVYKPLSYRTIRHFVHWLVQLLARAIRISEMKRGPLLVTKNPFISAKLLYVNIAGSPIKIGIVSNDI